MSGRNSKCSASQHSVIEGIFVAAEGLALYHLACFSMWRIEKKPWGSGLKHAMGLCPLCCDARYLSDTKEQIDSCLVDVALRAPRGKHIVMDFVPHSHSIQRWLLFLRDIAGGESASLKSAGRVAQIIEDQFLASGWPLGSVFANVEAVCERLNVGRRVCYDAMGILEMRGSAYVRRGPHGGLIVAAPSLEKVAFSLSLYLASTNVMTSEVLQARNTLYKLVIASYIESGLSPQELAALDPSSKCLSLPLRMAHQLNDGLSTFFIQLLEATAGSAVERQYGDAGMRSEFELTRSEHELLDAIQARDLKRARTLAKQQTWLGVDEAEPLTVQAFAGAYEHLRAGKYAVELAAQIARDMPALTALTNGRLGSEADMAERYRCNSEVIRQAVRILEDMGIIYILRGRGGGVVRTTPSPNSVIRQMYAHLAGMRLDVESAVAVASRLGAEVTSLMAQDHQRVHGHAQYLARAETQLREIGGALDIPWFIQFEHGLLKTFANPILGICLRSLALYIAWTGGREPDMQSLGFRYFSITRDLIAALTLCDATGARQAQEFKNVLFRNFILQADRASVPHRTRERRGATHSCSRSTLADAECLLVSNGN